MAFGHKWLPDKFYLEDLRNFTFAYFSQKNVWSVTKVSSNANSITYDITPQWETYGTVNIGIPAPRFPDGPVQVDHYKNGKLIATYN